VLEAGMNFSVESENHKDVKICQNMSTDC